VSRAQLKYYLRRLSDPTRIQGADALVCVIYSICVDMCGSIVSRLNKAGTRGIEREAKGSRGSPNNETLKVSRGQIRVYVSLISTDEAGFATSIASLVFRLA